MSRVTERKRPWRGVVALALLALSVVMARPICDAYALGTSASQPAPEAAAQHGAGGAAHHSGDSGTCCDAVSGTELVVTAFAAPVGKEATSVVLVRSAFAAAWPAVPGRRVVRHAPQAPPRTLAYHIRSARILA